MEASMIIDVSHKCSDGWHEFTSPQIPGLFLSAPQDDLVLVFEEIPVVIAELIKADTGMPVSVKAEQSYDEYVAGLPEEYRPSIRHYSVEKMAA
jgi:hypothetical protein